MSLFLEEERGMLPLAERARPKSLEGYFGQKHLLGEGKPIAQYLSRGKIPSMILWGGLVRERRPLLCYVQLF